MKLQKKLNKFIESLIGLEVMPEGLTTIEQMNWYDNAYNAWASEEVEKMLSHITGSEKQLKWVKIILRSYMLRIYKNGVDYAYWAAYYVAAVQASMCHTDAKWWIDNRDSLINVFSATTAVKEAKEKISALNDADSAIWDYCAELFAGAWEVPVVEEKAEEKVEKKEVVTAATKSTMQAQADAKYATFKGILARFSLIGSEKQVVWAEKIRHGIAWSIYKHLLACEVARLEKWLSMHTEARWWIEHKDDMYFESMMRQETR